MYNGDNENDINQENLQKLFDYYEDSGIMQNYTISKDLERVTFKIHETVSIEEV